MSGNWIVKSPISALQPSFLAPISFIVQCVVSTLRLILWAVDPCQQLYCYHSSTILNILDQTSGKLSYANLRTHLLRTCTSHTTCITIYAELCACTCRYISFHRNLTTSVISNLFDALSCSKDTLIGSDGTSKLFGTSEFSRCHTPVYVCIIFMRSPPSTDDFFCCTIVNNSHVFRWLIAITTATGTM